MLQPPLLSHFHVSAIEQPSMPAAPLFALTRHARIMLSRSSIASIAETVPEGFTSARGFAPGFLQTSSPDDALAFG
jgi:hypothetical protein